MSSIHHKVLVLMANQQEKFQFLQEHTDMEHSHQDEYVFATQPEQVKAVEVDDVVTTKLFWTRKDAKEIHELARSRVR